MTSVHKKYINFFDYITFNKKNDLKKVLHDGHKISGAMAIWTVFNKIEQHCSSSRLKARSQYDDAR